MGETVKRMGVLGGTFNPIHTGHLLIAEEIRERFSLDRVLFIPSHIPPHKSVEVAAAKDRMAMVRIAIADNPFFGLSDIEMRRGKKSYSVDTLRELRDKSQAKLFFLLGSEAFLQIHTWKDPSELFKYTDFIVMERGGREITLEEMEDYLLEFHQRFPQVEFYHQGKIEDLHVFTVHSGTSESRLYLTPVVKLGISSSEIRKRAQNGLSIKYRVPDRVEQFISEGGLYR
jgi:nicotinate-nucleotide adenylyltransferase